MVLRRILELLFVLVVGLLVTVAFLSPLRTTTYQDAVNRQTLYDRQQRGPRIFCMINTIPKNHKTRVLAVNDTWAKHCDEYVFTTTALTPQEKKLDIPYWVFDFSTPEKRHDDHDWLWDRIRAAFRKIHVQKLDDFDWFLKADDDSFVVIENLKKFLAHMDPDESSYLISRHWLLEKGRDPNQIYGSGGAGYVLSREAVKRFVEIMPKGDLCRNTSFKHEDTEVGECLKNANVTFVDAVDPKGRHSMLPINAIDLLSPNGEEKGASKWARDTSMVALARGPECCSDKLISAHYVKPDEMYLYYYLIYRVNVVVPQKHF